MTETHRHRAQTYTAPTPRRAQKQMGVPRRLNRAARERFATSTASADSHASDSEMPAGFSRSMPLAPSFVCGAFSYQVGSARHLALGRRHLDRTSARTDMTNAKRAMRGGQRARSATCIRWEPRPRTGGPRQARKMVAEQNRVARRPGRVRGGCPRSSVKRGRAHLDSGAVARTTTAVIATRATRIQHAMSRPLRRTSVVTRGVCSMYPRARYWGPL